MKKLLLITALISCIFANAQYQEKQMLIDDYSHFPCDNDFLYFQSLSILTRNELQYAEWKINGQRIFSDYIDFNQIYLPLNELFIVLNLNGYTDSLTLYLEEAPNISVDNKTICNGQTAVFKNISQNSGYLSYEWEDANSNIISTSDSLIVSTVGSYSLRLYNSKCVAEQTFTLSENTTGCTVSVSELSSVNLPAYPNPAENQIFVSDVVQGIYSISGSLAQVVNDNSLTINLNLSPGLYYIQYKSGKTEKLIVK